MCPAGGGGADRRAGAPAAQRACRRCWRWAAWARASWAPRRRAARSPTRWRRCWGRACARRCCPRALPRSGRAAACSTGARPGRARSAGVEWGLTLAWRRRAPFNQTHAGTWTARRPAATHWRARGARSAAAHVGCGRSHACGAGRGAGALWRPWRRTAASRPTAWMRARRRPRRRPTPRARWPGAPHRPPPARPRRRPARRRPRRRRPPAQPARRRRRRACARPRPRRPQGLRRRRRAITPTAAGARPPSRAARATRAGRPPT